MDRNNFTYADILSDISIRMIPSKAEKPPVKIITPAAKSSSKVIIPAVKPVETPVEPCTAGLLLRQITPMR